MGGYFFDHGEPSFFYASTYVPFEIDDYDFVKREWVHIGDRKDSLNIIMMTINETDFTGAA